MKRLSIFLVVLLLVLIISQSAYSQEKRGVLYIIRFVTVVVDWKHQIPLIDEFNNSITMPKFLGYLAWDPHYVAQQKEKDPGMQWIPMSPKKKRYVKFKNAIPGMIFMIKYPNGHIEKYTISFLTYRNFLPFTQWIHITFVSQLAKQGWFIFYSENEQAYRIYKMTPQMVKFFVYMRKYFDQKKYKIGSMYNLELPFDAKD